MINPTPAQIEDLIKYRLVGFNCRRYDNHILYARLMGYTNEQLYNLSQKNNNRQSLIVSLERRIIFLILIYTTFQALNSLLKSLKSNLR